MLNPSFKIKEFFPRRCRGKRKRAKDRNIFSSSSRGCGFVGNACKRFIEAGWSPFGALESAFALLWISLAAGLFYTFGRKGGVESGETVGESVKKQAGDAGCGKPGGKCGKWKTCLCGELSCCGYFESYLRWFLYRRDSSAWCFPPFEWNRRWWNDPYRRTPLQWRTSTSA